MPVQIALQPAYYNGFRAVGPATRPFPANETPDL